MPKQDKREKSENDFMLMSLVAIIAVVGIVGLVMVSSGTKTSSPRHVVADQGVDSQESPGTGMAWVVMNASDVDLANGTELPPDAKVEVLVPVDREGNLAGQGWLRNLYCRIFHGTHENPTGHTWCNVKAEQEADVLLLRDDTTGGYI
ncbi:hypothetical protein KY327_03540 [Candidatus Woesearchaeota archaeon]|nr:hypothetical protein [Candidatus Woesearchaeota archaeon]